MCVCVCVCAVCAVCVRAPLTDSDTVGRIDFSDHLVAAVAQFTCLTSIKVQILTPERQALVIPSLVRHILEPLGTFVVLLYQ